MKKDIDLEIEIPVENDLIEESVIKLDQLLKTYRGYCKKLTSNVMSESTVKTHLWKFKKEKAYKIPQSLISSIQNNYGEHSDFYKLVIEINQLKLQLKETPNKSRLKEEIDTFIENTHENNKLRVFDIKTLFPSFSQFLPITPLVLVLLHFDEDIFNQFTANHSKYLYLRPDIDENFNKTEFNIKNDIKSYSDLAQLIYRDTKLVKLVLHFLRNNKDNIFIRFRMDQLTNKREYSCEIILYDLPFYFIF